MEKQILLATPETHGVLHDGRDAPVIAPCPQHDPNVLVYGDTIRNARAKHRRNGPCPCGSGKKWKRCHHPRTRVGCD